LNFFQTILQYLQNLLYVLPAILIGLTVHEYAHAFVAFKLGDPTARNLGRMTLNPLAHIDPIGFLMLIIVRFGWAKPVPINPRNFKNYKRDDILVSLAGITANLIVAFLFSIVYMIGALKLGLGANVVFVNIVYLIVAINLTLAVFNLIPIPPLDGSHILDILLGRRFPRFIILLHQYGMWILIAFFVLSSFTGSGFGWLSNIVSGVANGFLKAAAWIVNLF